MLVGKSQIQRVSGGRRGKERVGEEVVVVLEVLDPLITEAGWYRYSLRGDGWPEKKRVSVASSGVTVQRGILISLD